MIAAVSCGTTPVVGLVSEARRWFDSPVRIRGASLDVYEAVPRGTATLSPGHWPQKTSPPAAGERRGTYTAPNRPPATAVSTKNVNRWVKARRTVSHGRASLTAPTHVREGVASGQAAETPTKGVDPPVATHPEPRPVL